MRPDEMCAKDAAGLLLDQRLVAVDRLGDAPRRVPIRYLLGLDAEFHAALARLLLAQPDHGDRRQGEGAARHRAVIRPVPVALQQIAPNLFAPLTPHPRPLSPPPSA